MLKPVAKKSLTAVTPPAIVDANAFADVLGVSPAYRQKENIRWNSAMQMYKKMSSHDLTLQMEQHQNDALIKQSTEQQQICPSLGSASNEGSLAEGAVLEEESDNDRDPSTSPPETPSTRSLGSKRSSTSTPFASIPIWTRYGYVTPPAGPITGPETEYALRLSEFRRSYSSLYNNNSNNNDNHNQDSTVKREESLNALELEAIAAVHELQFLVKDIFVSELLPRTSELIFLNITTAEGQAYCIELTVKGWRVTSLRHDCMNGDFAYIDLHTKYFETIYSLMDNISVKYRDRFSTELAEKLNYLYVDKPIKA